MKKLFLIGIFMSVAGLIFAQNQDQYNYSYNFRVSTLNGCVQEGPCEVSIRLTKDLETGYNMCNVSMCGQIIVYRVISGIVRDKVYPELGLEESNSTKKWGLHFFGDRTLLFRVGGIRYTFKNEELGTTIQDATESQQKEEINREGIVIDEIDVK